MVRNAKGQFQKGESGNPGGRGVADYSITALIDEAITKDDWSFIIDVLKKKCRRGDLKAIEMLFDRRFGKPKELKELQGNLSLTVSWDDTNSD